MHTLSPDLALRLAAAVDSVPPFPKSAQRILALSKDAACAPRDLVQVIEKDPVVTVKVLRVVNSAYYSLPKQITAIDRAVVFLGFNTIKNLALTISAMTLLPTNPLAHFDGQRYLLHSLVTAGIARQLAQNLTDTDPHDCFIAGLLHDFGKVVVAHFMPLKFSMSLEMGLGNGVSLHQAIEDVLGVDDAIVGAMLIEKWRFPGNLIETIRHQHEPHLSNTSMMACVNAAIALSQYLGFGFGTLVQGSDLPATVAQRLGFATLPELEAALGDMSTIVDDARLFAKT